MEMIKTKFYDMRRSADRLSLESSSGIKLIRSETEHYPNTFTGDDSLNGLCSKTLNLDFHKTPGLFMHTINQKNEKTND